MLGLELEDARAIAVRVDDRGGVQAHATVDAGTGDLTAAGIRAIDEVAGSQADAGILGVAAANPESPPVAAVLAALAPRFAGAYAKSGASPSGTASAVAESWIGAARGLQDVVFFGVGAHATGG